MDKLKKNWKILVIIILAIFALNKCTVSCNRSNELNNVKQTVIQKDSVISLQKDSIITLNNTIKLYEEKVNGLQNASEIKDQAIKNITEAKKNINVKIKK